MRESSERGERGCLTHHRSEVGVVEDVAVVVDSKRVAVDSKLENEMIP